MKTLTFKTNIKCANCVATVTPFLNKAVGAEHWQVDTQRPDKRLTVTSDTATPKAVQQAVQQAGYRADVVESDE